MCNCCTFVNPSLNYTELFTIKYVCSKTVFVVVFGILLLFSDVLSTIIRKTRSRGVCSASGHSLEGKCSIVWLRAILAVKCHSERMVKVQRRVYICSLFLTATNKSSPYMTTDACFKVRKSPSPPLHHHPPIQAKMTWT